MKAKLIIVFILLINISQAFSQWIQQGSGLNWYNPRWMSILSPDIAYFGADRGGFGTVVFKTTNGGGNWNLVYNNNPSDAEDKGGGRFFSGNVGYMAVDDKILKSTDGGYNWVQIYQTPGTFHSPINSLFMVSEYTGYAFFQNPDIPTWCVAKTTNGSSWSIIFQNSTYEWHDYNRAWFINENTGFIPGFWGKLYKTENGGNSWNTLTTPTEVNYVFPADQNNIFAVGSNNIYKSENSGSSWNTSYTFTTSYLGRSFFINSSTGWVCTEFFVFLKTTNGGNNWESLYSPANNLRFLSFYDQNTGWALGNSSLLYKTTNGGITPVPASVNLFSPENNSYDLPVNLTFAWYKPSEIPSLIQKNKENSSANKKIRTIDVITAYWFELTTDTLTFSNLARDTLLMDTLKAVNNLNNSTAYFWRVKAKNETGWGSFSSWWKFTTIQTIPPILALYTPQNRAFEVSTAPLLTWENITGAAKYWVQVSAFSNFNVLWVNDSSSTIAQLQVLPGILAYNSGYFWRVKARNSAGWGNFQTNPFVFYTKVTWPPYLRQPLNGAVGVSVNPTFDWDDFPGGTKYRIQVSLIPDFSSTLIDDTSSIISQFTVPPEKTLQNNQLYYWRAASKGTTWSDFSVNYSFTTASGNLTPPALIYPQKSDTGIVVTPLIDWSVVSGAERYRLQVSAFYNFSVLWIDTYTTSSEYQVPPGVLAYNSRYYWKVKSLNSGDSSVYSNISNFFTKIYPSPSELSFLKKEKEILIDISWLVVKKSQNYDIEICKDTLFNEPLLILENVSASNTIRVSAKCLQSFSTYFWRIKSYGISGVQYLPIKVFITGLLEENIKANIPSEFNLFQNYPNPFNPATRIKFDIPKNVYVKLEVYDALGSEVIVLLNKELAAGEYEITWNAFNIPSGIYFYRLSAGEYNRAKKMILLK